MSMEYGRSNLQKSSSVRSDRRKTEKPRQKPKRGSGWLESIKNLSPPDFIIERAYGIDDEGKIMATFDAGTVSRVAGGFGFNAVHIHPLRMFHSEQDIRHFLNPYKTGRKWSDTVITDDNKHYILIMNEEWNGKELNFDMYKDYFKMGTVEGLSWEEFAEKYGFTQKQLQDPDFFKRFNYDDKLKQKIISAKRRVLDKHADEISRNMISKKSGSGLYSDHFLPASVFNKVIDEQFFEVAREFGLDADILYSSKVDNDELIEFIIDRLDGSFQESDLGDRFDRKYDIAKTMKGPIETYNYHRTGFDKIIEQSKEATASLWNEGHSKQINIRGTKFNVSVKGTGNDRKIILKSMKYQIDSNDEPKFKDDTKLHDEAVIAARLIQLYLPDLSIS